MDMLVYNTHITLQPQKHSGKTHNYNASEKETFQLF